MSAKEVIHNVLYDLLSSREYDADEIKVWCKEVADTIKDKLRSVYKSLIYQYFFFNLMYNYFFSYSFKI